MIPIQLKEEGFRFIKVRDNKAPLEPNWQKDNNYSYDDVGFNQFIQKNKRYGVVTGYNHLVVIDFDNRDVQEKVIPKLPDTFTVKTAGKGLLHLYFFVDDPQSFKVLDLNKDTIADIQGVGKQVIGAGTLMPNGKTYEVVKDIPISNVKIELIRKVFSEWTDIEVGVEHKNKKENDDICLQIKSIIKVKDVLGMLGIDTRTNPTDCPFHSSKGGRCFSFNENVWHCFHCDKKGTIFHLLMEKNGISFTDAKKILADRAGVEITTKPKLKTNNFLQNVESFYTQQPFFYDKSGIFWIWNFESNKYVLVDDIDMMNYLDEIMQLEGTTIDAKIKNTYLEAFKRIGRKKEPKKAPKKWIQFKDKAFSLESGNIYDVTPDFFFTNPIPHEIGISEDTPVMDKLFGEWVGTENLELLYEIIAYCCYSDYPIQLLFCLYGAGRNGKTSFSKVLTKFIGQDNICSTELDTLLTSRFETFKLYKKLICTLGETNFGILSKTSLLKKLVGGDVIGYEKKNKDPFDEYNYAKIIISSNSLPTSTDTSDGFYRRWLIIKFPFQFPEGKDIVTTIPDNEYSNLALKITRILKKLLENGSFKNQGDINKRKLDFIMASNPLPMFLHSCCDIGTNNYISYNELYTAYVAYLRYNKKRRILTKEFKSALEDEGFWVERTSKAIGTNDYGNSIFQNGYWIEGLTLKSDWEQRFCDSYANYATVLTPISRMCNRVGNNTTKFTKSTNQPPLSEAIITDSEEIVHHNCTICGSTDKVRFDSTMKPVCDDCNKPKDA